MQNKNKNIILIGLIGLLIIAILGLVGLRVFYPESKYIAGLENVKTASNLDEYISAQPDMLQPEVAKPMGLEKVAVTPPVPVKLPDLKITLVPELAEGGDTIYVPVANFEGNKFFDLNPDNYKNVFSITSAEDAVKYAEFITVTAGLSSYERAKKVVRKSSDYDTIGCKVMSNEQNEPMPSTRPISSAKKVGDKYEVTLVYNTPVYPAGYYTIVYTVDKDGNITPNDKSSQLFWPCGKNKGIVF